MIAVKLNIQDEVYEKVMYFLKSLPKQDIQIIDKKIIDEVNPTVLSENNFDYISQKELDEMDKEMIKVKNGDTNNFVDFEKWKNELSN